MGCCNEKVHKKEISSLIICEEEELIKDLEKELPFTKVWVDEVAGLFLQYKHKTMMNGQEAHHVLTNMGFNEERLSDPDSFVYFFMKSLKNERGLYSIQKVFVTALLLSSGKSEEKALMLFDIFDSSGMQVLTRAEFAGLVVAVFNVAVLNVPETVVNELDQSDNNGRMKKERFVVHWKRMEARKTYFINRILEKVLGEENSITRKKFATKVVEDPVVGSLIWSYLIRLILLE